MREICYGVEASVKLIVVPVSAPKKECWDRRRPQQVNIGDYDATGTEFLREKSKFLQ